MVSDRLIDIVAGGLMVFASFGLFGAGTVEIWGWDISETWFTIYEGYGITWSQGLSVLILAGAWVYNRPTWNRLSGLKKMLLGLTAGLVIASIVLPDQFGQVFDGIEMEALGIAVTSGGYWGIADN